MGAHLPMNTVKVFMCGFLLRTRTVNTSPSVMSGFLKKAENIGVSDSSRIIFRLFPCFIIYRELEFLGENWLEV